MKPDVDRLLEVSAIALMTEIGPGLRTSYEQSSAGALGALLLALREEFERGAARRVEENDAIRALCAEAADLVTEPSLARRVREASTSKTTSFAISALESDNVALRGLLTELHAHVESLDSDAGRVLVDAIWCELARSTERRRLAMAAF